MAEVVTLVVGVVIGALLVYFLMRQALEARTRSELADWKRSEEARIRDDSMHRSRSVLKGRIAEQMAPMLPGFKYNPADARFVGSPIDLVILDGYTDVKDGAAQELRAIVFAEIKTGKAQLNAPERAVRACIEAGRVRWELLRLQDAGLETTRVVESNVAEPTSA